MREVYLNHLQQVMFYASARDVRLSGARRFGKTDGSIAPRINAIAMSMPRGTNLWLGNSRKQLYSRTVPGTIAALSRMFKYVEGVHFGWGRPPKNVPMPVIQPKNWDNVIWFANGSIFQLISLAVTGSANSITANSVIGDECKFMSKAKIDGDVVPAVSGIVHPDNDPRFSDHNPLYKSSYFASDASLTAKGNWLEKEIDEIPDKIIELGPMAGKRYGDVQSELDHYAERIIFYNNLIRNAKKEGVAPEVVEVHVKERIEALAQAIINHEGQFHILPNWGRKITKSVLDMCLNYNLITVDDAELLLKHQFLMTKEQHFELMKLTKSNAYKKHIQQLRCSAMNCYKASTLDNIDILGESYIARMKRDLPPVVFAISILNMKVRKSNDGFYSNLDIENIHGYIPDDCPAIDAAIGKKVASGVFGKQRIDREYETPDFDDLQKIKNCTLDGDVKDDLPLHIAMDTNANINWFVTGQVYNRDGVEALNVLSSMFVKNERKLRALCSDWNKYYAPHKQHNRTVNFYFDQTNKRNQGYAVEGQLDFKDVVIEELTGFGWEVNAVDMGKVMDPELRYKDINESLAGVAWPAIRFNRENNEALIVAMENAEVRIGYDGFKKDKSGEKLSEESDEAVRLEFRTDGTDAFDNLYIGVRYRSGSTGWVF